MELNYPGTVEMKAKYILEPKADGQATLSLTMEAKHSGPEDEHHDCPINMTNHSYFNLSGHASGENIMKHHLQLNAHGYTVTDGDSIPTKEVRAHDGDPYDFRKPRLIEEAMVALGTSLGYSTEELDDLLAGKTALDAKGAAACGDPLGFDHNWALNSSNEEGGMREIAVVQHPASGREMKVHSTAPGVQFYTAKYVGEVPGKGGAIYKQWHGLCLETQAFPDSIGVSSSDHPDFAKGACFILRRGGPNYFHKTAYEMGQN